MKVHALALEGAPGMRKIVLVLAAAAATVMIGTVAWAQVAPPATPTLAVQKVRLLDPAQLVVDGTIQCQAGNDYSVSAKVTELAARDGVRTSTVAAGRCAADGPQAWSVTVTGSGGTFVPVVTTSGTLTDPATQKATINVDQRGVDIVNS
jgi:hypothetical protein